MRRAGGRLACACAALLLASLARAAIPGPEKIADAVAEANRLGGRSEPLLIEVKLRFGEAPPVASGTLASHPTGLARLELESYRGFVERHLLQGSEYRASRNGRLLEEGVRPFLPPVFLLQATDGAALRAALGSYGVEVGEAVLGRAGDHDCWVLGGRLPRSAAEGGVRPSVWVDIVTHEVVRIDRADGVRFRVGPTASFEGVRAPRWISIEAPGQPVARLELERVSRANAPAAAFGVEWLTPPPTAPEAAQASP